MNKCMNEMNGFKDKTIMEIQLESPLNTSP